MARENANIAIPAKYIINFINEHNQSKITISNEAQLLEKANEFVKALDDYKKSFHLSLMNIFLKLHPVTSMIGTVPVQKKLKT